MAGGEILSDLKVFDDSRTGVKGLVDSGVFKIPRIFVDEKRKAAAAQEIPAQPAAAGLSIPFIDFTGVEDDPSKRAEVVRKIGDACEKWGFL